MFRKVRYSRLVLPVLLIVLLVGFGAGMVLAGQSEKAEEGPERPIDRTPSLNHEEVTGNTAEQSPDDYLLNAEGQPETERPDFFIEEVELLEDPDAPQAQFYKRVAGSNFHPRDSDISYAYRGAGCVVREAGPGDSWFTTDLQVPEGAVIDFFRVYYYDNTSTYGIDSELWAFDGAGGVFLIAEADSIGSPGYGSTGSGSFNYSVDNTDEALVVVASIPEGAGYDLALCGVRIRYQYTLVAANFLPSVLNLTAP